MMKMNLVILGLTILVVIIVVETDILANIVKMVKVIMILITIMIVITTIDNTTIEVVVNFQELE